MYCQLEWRIYVSSVYVHSSICDSYLVKVFHRCIVNWSGGICILSICAFCYIVTYLV